MAPSSNAFRMPGFRPGDVGWTPAGATTLCRAVIQLAEDPPFKRKVVRSSRTGPTTPSDCFVRLIGFNKTPIMSVTTYSGTNTNHEIIQRGGGVTEQIQKVCQGTDDLDFGGSATGNMFDAQAAAPAYSSVLNVEGFAKAVFKIEYNDGSASATFRVMWLDHNATPGWVPGIEITPSNTGILSVAAFPTLETGDVYYHGESFEVDVNGAKSLKLYIASITSADDVSVWGAAI
jgi:hypothetical protein